jgi:hypothetical protein
MNTKSLGLLAALASMLALSGVQPAQAAGNKSLDCKLAYQLNEWSLVYKHATGTGTVSCDDGQTLPVTISAKALGLTAGKWQIDNGKGRFTNVHGIREVLGKYAQAGANIGLGKSGATQVLTKGKVSLALAGSGEGVNIGVDVGEVVLAAK